MSRVLERPGATIAVAIALLRHRPSRRVAYYAAVAAVARLALLELCRWSLPAIIERCFRQVSAWHYARKFLLNHRRSSSYIELDGVSQLAIPFEERQRERAFDELPASPRRESRSPSLVLPPISEEPLPAESSNAMSMSMSMWGSRSRHDR